MQLIPSGSALLDYIIGGGWASGRISNVCGLESTGKTQIAIEACVNMRRQFPDASITYIDAESAFDSSYAEAVGLDPDSFVCLAGHQVGTVEDFFVATVDFLENADGSTPNLLILDSLDSLSDEAEQNKVAKDLKKGEGFTEGSFGAEKAKALSKFFRVVPSRVRETNTHLMIISQLRENLGFGFKKYVRSGGKALGFYSSTIIQLTKLKDIKRTLKGVDRTIGIDVRAKCTKNKIASPYKECEFPIMFHYGIDDVQSCCTWLDQHKAAPSQYKQAGSLFKEIDGLEDRDAYDQMAATIRNLVQETWRQEEAQLAPKRSKY